MKQNNVLVAAIVCASVAIVGLSGCGGSSNSGGGGGGGTPPTITSFTGSPAIIEAGSSASLTAVFSGGTGVITPGNIAASSGTAVSVSPATTTMYTLTVTSSGGLVSSQTSTVTVDPLPTITSFSAGAATIEAGSSTSLTAVFSGGTGTITAPGGYSSPVTSGIAVSISPTTTTPYTLTVTPPVGTVNATMMTTVTVDPVPTITSFSANPNPITTSGGSSALTAVFAGGTGTITAPGGYSSPVTSGVAVNVSPTATTTYTLTVTPPVGTVNATQAVTVTVAPPPVITSFTVAPTAIEDGSSAQLTAVFSGGTGVVTPGNITMTSGTPVSVLPTSTTTYTLTVTPPAGQAIKQTTTLTVSPAPAITSFTANPTTIAAGSSSTLTPVFSGGTGVITPGNITATSGTGVSVSPTTTTTYTLTVTPALGNAITAMATVTLSGTSVTVNQTPTTVAVTDQLMGMNMAIWYDFTNGGSYTASNSPIVAAYQNAGIVALRWPGGSDSDDYHWNGANANPANGTAPSPSGCEGEYLAPNTNYLSFINNLEYAITSGFDVALTADYGTNPQCNGGGEPSEAANWVTYAYANGGKVSHVTVGNEEYGSWEEDLHASPHDPTTYADAVIGTSGYYDLIKNASQAAGGSTLVGVVVDADGEANGWDSTVLTDAGNYYDFVEYHYYPQYSPPSVTSDTPLVYDAAPEFTNNIKTIKTELANAHEPDTPIYVGELGANSANPGTQSWSITQGLYAGQILGEAMNDGVARLTWWIGVGNCLGSADVSGAGGFNNNNSSLYGWQDTWGSYNVFSDADANCPGAGPIGTMSPTGIAFDLLSHVAVTGEHVLTPSVAGDTTDVRAYAATHSGGTALVLFNLNETTAEAVTVTLSTEANSPGVTEYTYDKEMYDYTNTSCASDPTCTVDPNHSYANIDWVGPTTTSLGAQPLPLTVTLQPWSMNVLIIQ